MKVQQTKDNIGFTKAELSQALAQFVKDGKLRMGWNKKGEIVYQDTRVKPTKGVRWAKR